MTAKDRKIHRHMVEVASDAVPALAEAMRDFGPIGFPEREDEGLGNFLAQAVIGQQISTSAARSIWDRIEGAAAEAKQSVAMFCAAENAAALKACGVSRNKIKALGSIRDAELQGMLSSAEVRAMSDEARSGHLTSIWGIGQWTCDMAAISYCRSPDIWPLGDVAVQRTFKRYLGRRSPARAAARFAPYRSYLALHMWRIVNAMP